jgi:hypothetical protein
MRLPLDFGHSVKGREAELLVSCNVIGGNRQPLNLRPYCEPALRSGEKNITLLIVGPFKHVKPWEKLPLGEFELACG